jgi:hypothetical protein
VIIYAYQHVRLLPPESLVVNQSVLRSREPTLLCNQVTGSRIEAIVETWRRNVGMDGTFPLLQE